MGRLVHQTHLAAIIVPWTEEYPLADFTKLFGNGPPYAKGDNNMSSYKLSLNSVRSINRTIVAVNQMRKTGIAGDLPFRQNARKGKTANWHQLRRIMINKTNAEWTNGDGQIIKPLEALTEDPVGDPVAEVSVLNLFATVASGLGGGVFQNASAVKRYS